MNSTKYTSTIEQDKTNEKDRRRQNVEFRNSTKYTSTIEQDKTNEKDRKIQNGEFMNSTRTRQNE
jgi:hypothetical protein